MEFKFSKEEIEIIKRIARQEIIKGLFNTKKLREKINEDAIKM